MLSCLMARLTGPSLSGPVLPLGPINRLAVNIPTHSVQKSLHSVGGLLQPQAYNTPDSPDDTSYQITLMAATSH